MRRSLISFGLAALIVLIWPATALAATTDPLLGTSGYYAVLASATITSTGSSWITGQMALSPGTSITGFPPGTSGHQDINDGAALSARNDAEAAYVRRQGDPAVPKKVWNWASAPWAPGSYGNPP